MGRWCCHKQCHHQSRVPPWEFSQDLRQRKERRKEELEERDERLQIISKGYAVKKRLHVRRAASRPQVVPGTSTAKCHHLGQLGRTWSTTYAFIVMRLLELSFAPVAQAFAQ